MDQPELSTILEAILFGAGRSMTVGEIAFAAQEDEGLVEGALSNLRATLSRRRLGA